MVRFADQHGIKVTVRGQGHSIFGQSQNTGGLLIDTSTMNTVHAIEAGSAVVDAGCTWRKVLDAALAGPRPQTPKVLTGFTLLSVGGTLSAGGISGMAYAQGCLVEHVLELKVVTGDGKVVVCSEAHERALFDAVLAGQGQCAVILQATIPLRPAPPRTKDYTLFFKTLPALMTAMNALLDEARLDLIWGGAAPTPAGFVYPLFANAHFDPATGPEPDVADLFRAVDLPMPPIVVDRTYREYIEKVDQDILSIPWGPGRYPVWLDVFVPQEGFDDYVGGIISGSQPDDLGQAALILFFPLESASVTRPLLRVPAGRRSFMFDYFRNTDPTTPEKAEELIARNHVLYREGVAMGATVYPIGAVPMTHEDWKQHYGPAWEAFAKAKRSHDPRGTLGSGVTIFADGAAPHL
jgi:FAD/FMN-containing dehydrogenase